MGLIDETHAYSYTQLTSFDECPYNFYLQRIEHVDDTVSNAFSERGSLIHDLLDKWSKKELDKAGMINEYEQRYGDEVVTPYPRFFKQGYARQQYEKGLEFLENFDEFEGFNVVSSEEKFNILLPLSDGSTRKFVGIIDLMLKDKNTGDLIICDHKSKSLDAFKKAENDMYKQQLMYSVHVKEKYGEYPFSMMFHLFNADGRKMERLFSKEQLDETLKWAEERIHMIESYELLDWFTCKEKQDFYCQQLCSTRRLCNPS